MGEAYLVLKLWIFGFLLPWLIGIYLIWRNRGILLVVGPIGSVLAFVINAVGIYMGFWTLRPISNTISTLPFEVGLYPILAVFMVHIAMLRKVNPIWLVIVFALATTVMEQMALWIGWVTYGHGWNTWWTFLSYMLPYWLVMWHAKSAGIITQK
jgi:hypothetical protein